jgi:hypothetical protein
MASFTTDLLDQFLWFKAIPVTPTHLIVLGSLITVITARPFQDEWYLPKVTSLVRVESGGVALGVAFEMLSDIAKTFVGYRDK